jgi:hypothetical protein
MQLGRTHALKIATPILVVFVVLYLSGFLWRMSHHPVHPGNSYSGEIVSIVPQGLLVRDATGRETLVVVEAATSIRKGRVSVATSTLASGSFVIAFGHPTDTSFVADSIRIVDRLRVPGAR